LIRRVSKSFSGRVREWPPSFWARKFGGMRDERRRLAFEHGTYFEIRCVRDGIATPLREHCDTLSQGREQAAYKAKALGFDRYVELENGEQFHDQEADGVYLTTVTVVKFATAV
jgi:hypothetical protein